MWRYILRRTLYMIPTVFGVILLTFFLFNIAGGDPALQKLGKQADAKSLEEYDIPRGYNKPLFCGLWGSTRAYRGETFEHNAGPWTQIEGVTYTSSVPDTIIVSASNKVTVPMALDLHPDTEYRWTLVCRAKPTTVGPFPALEVHESNSVLASVPIPLSQTWEIVHLRFHTPVKQGEIVTLLTHTQDSPVQIQKVVLNMKVKHVLDSQLVFYLRQLVHGDFGTSIETNQRVSRMILEGVIPSLSLTVPMFFVGLVMELSLALVCAFFRNRLLDRLLVVFAVMMMSVNYLVWIMAAQYWLAYRFKWFPVWGYDSWHYLLLPITVGVVTGLGGSVRFYRTIMLDEMYRDYVRTAEAKGVGKGAVLFKHVLKNAMIPILTNVVTVIPFLYTGSLLLESFFGIPGLGNLAVNAFNSSDVDVIRAVVFIGAMMFVVTNLITDLCYTWVDPRVRLQ